MRSEIVPSELIVSFADNAAFIIIVNRARTSVMILFYIFLCPLSLSRVFLLVTFYCIPDHITDRHTTPCFTFRMTCKLKRVIGREHLRFSLMPSYNGDS